MLNYLIIGAGSTGLALGSHLLKNGLNVSFVARGKTLESVRENGISFDVKGKETISYRRVNIYSPEDIEGTYDVIFVCVKYYSLLSVIDIVNRVSDGNTVVVTFVNVYGAGEELQAKLPNTCVLDGYMFIVADTLEAGKGVMYSDDFTVVYGERNKNLVDIENLGRITEDISSSGIKCIFTENIRLESFKEYAFNCAYSAVTTYHDATAADLQTVGSKERDEFMDLILEMKSLGRALDINVGEDFLGDSFKVLAKIPPKTTTCMQKDIAEGKDNEMDGFIFRPVRLGKTLGVDMPKFEKIARHYGCGRRNY